MLDKNIDLDNGLVDLAKDLDSRLVQVHNRADVSELKIADAFDLVETAASYVLIGIRKESTLTNMIATIGHRTRDKLGKKRDSVKAAKVGAFILDSFYNLDLIKLDERKANKHAKHTSYHVESNNDEALTDLWELIPNEKSDHMPLFDAPDDWVSGIHANGLPLVRHAPKSILNKFSLEDHGIVFDVINKHQNQGWVVESQMLRWYITAINNQDKATVEIDGELSVAFDHMDPNESRKASRSMRLEADTIKKMAKKTDGREFFHMYNVDFRGRFYPNTAYLHEQGSDKAKGLLRMARGKKLGVSGFKWLCVHAANSFGKDKVSIKDRFEFAADNFADGSWLKYAQDPFTHKGWINTDKCWSFLACCLEFKKIDDWIQADNNVEDYVCDLPVFIDGSNNGVQWLTALSKDETVAPHVNLVPQELPGDVYMFIADKCWDIVEADYDPALDADLDKILAEIIPLKQKFESKLSKEEFALLVQAIGKYRDENKNKIRELNSNFWMRVSNAKHKRKVTKRPCMTLGYGGTEYGFKEQIVDDTSKVSEHLRYIEYPWAAYMGSMIFDVCRGNAGNGIEASLPGPAKMLTLFETLAGRAADAEKPFEWTVPFTNFPVVQQYRKPLISRVSLSFGGKSLKLNIQIMEDQKIKKSKQKTAASPNIIHSFDAAHLAMTVQACSFPTATVHDSFGCLPCDMGELFWEVRSQFVKLADSEPLERLLKEQDAMDLMPELGTLDLHAIMDSDYAFI